MKNYREIPVRELALQLAGRKDIDVAHMLRQAEGWQCLRHKVPAWAAIDELEYPPRLSLEQCSGEPAARYKAEIVRSLFPLPEGVPCSLADLTGGLGVDFSFLAPLFESATYVERQEVLCDLARHNFPLLGLTPAQSTVVCGDGTDYLRTMEPVGVLFLDPARRDTAGRKTVLIEDCEPDICSLRQLLLTKARYVLVKLSTMLDITRACRSVGQVREVHVFSTAGECKDLLLLLDRETPSDAEPRIIVREGEHTLAFTMQEELSATPIYTGMPETYLYEAGPAVLKAGAFKLTAVRYGLKKLHPNSHLYTSCSLVSDFPGRKFRVLQTFTFNKQELRKLRSQLTQANLAVRNFPSSVEALRKKLKLREGGTAFLFATTAADESHLLILCEKVG